MGDDPTQHPIAVPWQRTTPRGNGDLDRREVERSIRKLQLVLGH
jgi:hypothetical protein